tara:strand:- start:109 stop:420 length:312 start_codon:yes stop_codon:yes gene_type:complete
MALKDAPTPEIKPMGSPVGRFESSPLADTNMGDLTKPDIFAREEVGGMDKFPDIPEPQQIPGEIDGKLTNPNGFHNATEAQHQGTYGTRQITSLSQNDPFADL